MNTLLYNLLKEDFLDNDLELLKIFPFIKENINKLTSYSEIKNFLFRQSEFKKEYFEPKIKYLYESYLRREPTNEEIEKNYLLCFFFEKNNQTLKNILYQILTSYEYYQLSLKSNTPFEVFRISEEKKQWFLNVSKIGLEKMKGKKIIITGLIRDNQKIIPYLQSFFYELVPYFLDIRFLIVENDSKDLTRQYLLQWATKDPRIEILGGKNINDPIAKLKLAPTPTYKPVESPRIKKMSILRNLYLKRIRQAYPHFDYTMVIDLDIHGKIYLDGLFHSFGLLEENLQIDGLSANGCLFYSNFPQKSYQPSYTSFEMTYYDPFALVEKGKSVVYQSFQEKRNHDALGVEYAKKLQIGQLPIPITSGFAGCCIYRQTSILSEFMLYDFTPFKYSCEHAHFNKHLKDLRLNPSMIYFCLKH